MAIKILLCRVGEEPELVDIAPALDKLQALVGGDLQEKVIDRNDTGPVVLAMNEDKKGLKLNSIMFDKGPTPIDVDFSIRMQEGLAKSGQLGLHYVYGDIFIMQVRRDGTETSLGKKEIERYTELFSNLQKPKGSDHKIRVLSLLEE